MTAVDHVGAPVGAGGDAIATARAETRARIADRRARGDEAEGGFVLVWMSLSIMVLLALGGLAVDYAHWYLVANRAQKAADAAALAGAVYLPQATSTGYSTALDTARINGFTNGGSNIVVAGTGTRPTQLQVSVTTTVDTFFGRLVGVDTQTIRRTAVAEFERPVPLGSPANSYGNQPGDTGQNTATNDHPGYWANVFGPASDKPKGDAHQSNRCASGTDGCTGSTNVDYRPDGYYYVVDVSGSTAGRTLQVEIYDPAFIHTGDNCNAADQDNELLQGVVAARTASPANPNYRPEYDYGLPQVNSHYCPGDQRYTEGSEAPWTSFQVFAPDASPWNNLDNPPVTSASCLPRDFRPIYLTAAGSLWNMLNGPATNADSVYTREVFRRWVVVCQIPNPVAGEYLLRVRTNVTTNGTVSTGDDVSRPNGGGANRFAIRSQLIGGANTQISVYATDAMSMYVSDVATGATFYLARVTPSAGARYLHLNFFDIADGNGSGNLRINPPADATVNGSTMSSFPVCQYTPPPGSTLTATGSGCSIPISSSGSYNGQWVEAVVQIPDNYQCNTSSAFGCWITISYNLSGQVNDTTTWNARLEGDPVRLIE